MKNLVVGMDSGIGSSAAEYSYGFFKNTQEAAFYPILYCIPIRLALPPAEICSIIGT
jgi:hypothetical protein